MATTSYNSGGQFCSAPNCSNSRRKCQNLSFHRFPKDKERCKRWVINCRRADLMDKSPDYLYKNCVLCREHFESGQFLDVKDTKSNLIRAKPTLFDVHNPPPSVGKKRPAPRIRLSSKPKVQKLEYPDATVCQSKCSLSHEEEKANLRKKNHSLRMQIARLKQHQQKMANKVLCRAKLLQVQDISRHTKITSLTTTLSEFLSDRQLSFVVSQVKMSTRKAKGRRWSAKEKSLALSLLHSSPKTYRLLRKVFVLPSVTTLRTVLRRVNVVPGFNQTILDALKMKVSSLPPKSKIVSVAIDEMAIKDGISYDAGQDIIEGFSEGLERTNELANHAIAFMVRGIVDKWKQPIGYFLSSGPMSGNLMFQLLKQCIDHLQNAGLKVVVFLCDQGSNNQNLMSKHLSVTTNNPFFTVGSDKIFAMYDPPHLIKNVRNNLQKHGFVVDGHDISWTHIQDFFEKDSSKPICLAPKLTNRHIELPPFSKIRVKLATQVLSHSVAAGMSVMAEWNIIPGFLEKMDQLFNAFNSMTVKSTSCMRHALSDTSGHLEFLKDIIPWLRSIKTKGKRRPACLKGWELSVSSLLQLWNHLHVHHDLRFLLTNRLNQDAVENLFSIIRSKGAERDNPDAGQFRAAFHQVMVDSVLMPIKSSNCEEDVDEFLFNLSSLDKSEQTSPLPTDVEPIGFSVQSLPASVRDTLSVCCLPEAADGFSIQETNILTYIAGYFVKKLGDKICVDCYSKLLGELDPNKPEHAFLLEKNYINSKFGLKAPSNILFDITQSLETEYRASIPQLIVGYSVKAKLNSSLSKNKLVEELKCSLCHAHELIVHLFVNVRLHFDIIENNRKLVANKDRKNRKTLKFSHM